MGLAERGYYDDQGGRQRMNVGGMTFTTMLIIANVAIFVLDALSAGKGGVSVLQRYGFFSTYELVHNLEFWRVLTFQFLHANVTHVLFNMLGLWVFGRIAEEYLGFKRYAAFYLVCGIAGAVMYMVLNLLGDLATSSGYPNLPIVITNSTRAPLIGASAGVYGVIMAAAFIAPRAMMQLMLPPVTLPLRTVAYLYVGIAFFVVLVGGNNAGGQAAHIGGAIAGYFFVRNSHLLRDFFDVLGDSRKTAKPGSARAKGPSKLDVELDRILAKVRAEGLQSLTDRERRALQEATGRQQKAG